MAGSAGIWKWLLKLMRLQAAVPWGSQTQAPGSMSQSWQPRLGTVPPRQFPDHKNPSLPHIPAQEAESPNPWPSDRGREKVAGNWAEIRTWQGSTTRHPPTVQCPPCPMTQAASVAPHSPQCQACQFQAWKLTRDTESLYLLSVAD